MSDTDKAGDHEFHHNARAAFLQQNLRWETENAFLNHQLLFEMRMEGRARCLSECTPHRGPAIIVGSGSTLDGVIDRLKDWRGGLLCSTSHGTTLVHHGCPPTYLVCMDPRVAPDPELDVPEGGWDQTHYLAHVSSPRPYFDKWFSQSQRLAYLFRILEPTVPWYTRHLKWAYPWVKMGLLPMIDSVASTLSLAAKMGYDPLFCIGVDYGGPRFQQSKWTGKAWLKADTSGAETGQSLKGTGGISIDKGMMYAKRGMLISTFMKMMDFRNPTRIYQMSQPTNIVEFPFVSFDEVLEKQGNDFPPWTAEFRAEVAEKIETYLAKSDTYMIPVEGGFGIDYRVFMFQQQNIVQALSQLSAEMLDNKGDLLGKEAQTKMSVREMIEKEIIVAEMGELVIHDRSDLKHFSAASMKGIEVEKVADRIRMLYAKSKELAG